MSKVNMSSIPTQPDKLRIDFIGMAFALAIGEIGLEIGKLYIDGISLRGHLYLVTHIMLAVYVIASSWIGWQLSESQGNKEELRDPFSLSFIILLLDLLLVICYFIIVQCIGQHPKDPDAKNQIFWSWVIFIIYAVWDIFTKYFIEDPTTGKATVTDDIKKYFNRAYQAPLCFALVYFFISPLESAPTSNRVICLDVLLISVFVLFRGLKNFKKSRKKKSIICIFLPALVFIVIFLLVKYKL